MCETGSVSAIFWLNLVPDDHSLSYLLISSLIKSFLNHPFAVCTLSPMCMPAEGARAVQGEGWGPGVVCWSRWGPAISHAGPEQLEEAAALCCI